MRSAAYTDGPGRRLVRVSLQPRDEGLQVICGESPPCGDKIGLGREQRDRFEVPQQVVLQRIDSTVADVCAPAADDDRISVRCRTCDPPNADAASRATHVLNDDGLTKRLPHPLGHDASYHVRPPTRR